MPFTVVSRKIFDTWTRTKHLSHNKIYVIYLQAGLFRYPELVCLESRFAELVSSKCNFPFNVHPHPHIYMLILISFLTLFICSLFFQEFQFCPTFFLLFSSSTQVSEKSICNALFKMDKTTQKMAVFFWVVEQCSLIEIYQRFGCACCFHHQGAWLICTDHLITWFESFITLANTNIG
jgi:hypothetical protein